MYGIRERKGNSERRDILKKGERSSMLLHVQNVCVWWECGAWRCGREREGGKGERGGRGDRGGHKENMVGRKEEEEKNEQ